LTIGAERGGCRRTCADVISGKVESRPASMTEHQVERDGEKTDAWMKAMRLESESVERVELAVCSTSVGLVSSCVPGRSSC